MSESARELMVREHIETENRHDMAAMLATLAEDDPVRDEVAGKAYRGQSDVAGRYAELWCAFPDFAVTPTELHDSGSVVVMQADYTGTHSGPYRGHPGTGRRFNCRIVVVFRFNDGRITSETIYMDLAGQLRQLGLTQDKPSDA
jgi:steroid delta-isomerase-like uncharacterized protein